jgi:hypothetical protein
MQWNNLRRKNAWGRSQEDTLSKLRETRLTSRKSLMYAHADVQSLSLILWCVILGGEGKTECHVR